MRLTRRGRAAPFQTHAGDGSPVRGQPACRQARRRQAAGQCSSAAGRPAGPRAARSHDSPRFGVRCNSYPIPADRASRLRGGAGHRGRAREGWAGRAGEGNTSEREDYFAHSRGGRGRRSRTPKEVRQGATANEAFAFWHPPAAPAAPAAPAGWARVQIIIRGTTRRAAERAPRRQAGRAACWLPVNRLICKSRSAPRAARRGRREIQMQTRSRIVRPGSNCFRFHA